VLRRRPEREDGEEGEAVQDDDHADRRPDEGNVANEAGAGRRKLDRELYVIVSNDLVSAFRTWKPRIGDIGGAALSSLIRGNGVCDAYKLYTIAQRDEIGFNVTWTPADVSWPAAEEDFDRAVMCCLYDFGGSAFDSGRLWSDAPPFFATRLPDHEDPS
jgi:hypothetical protein